MKKWIKELKDKEFSELFEKQHLLEKFPKHKDENLLHKINNNTLLNEKDKEVIQKTQENGLNATKSTENTENKSGDTQQNKLLSSENKEEETSK